MSELFVDDDENIGDRRKITKNGYRIVFEFEKMAKYVTLKMIVDDKYEMSIDILKENFNDCVEKINEFDNYLKLDGKSNTYIEIDRGIEYLYVECYSPISRTKIKLVI